MQRGITAQSNLTTELSSEAVNLKTIYHAKRLAIFRNYLAMAVQIQFAQQTTSVTKGDELSLLSEGKTLSTKYYHINRIENAIGAEKETDLSKESNEFSHLNTDSEVEIRTIENLQEKIMQSRLARMELDCVELFSRPGLHNRDDLIRIIVSREIVKNFFEALLYEEKNYFWELNVWSKIFSAFGDDFASFTEKQYKTDGFSDLLQHEQLQRLITDFDIAKEMSQGKHLIDSIKDQIKDHIKNKNPRLNSLREEEKNKLWKKLIMISSQSNAAKSLEWIQRFQKFAEDNLISPLNEMEKIICALDADLPNTNNTLISLIKHAEQALDNIGVKGKAKPAQLVEKEKEEKLGAAPRKTHGSPRLPLKDSQKKYKSPEKKKEYPWLIRWIITACKCIVNALCCFGSDTKTDKQSHHHDRKQKQGSSRVVSREPSLVSSVEQPSSWKKYQPSSPATQGKFRPLAACSAMAQADEPALGRKTQYNN